MNGHNIRNGLLAAIGGLAIAVLVSVGAASAHTPNYSATCQGGVVAGGTLYPAGSTATATLDSTTKTATATGNGAFGVTIPNPDKTVSHTFHIVIVSTDHQLGSEVDKSGTIPACETPVTTIPATTVPATTVPATTIPATTVPVTTLPATTIPATTIPVTTEPVTTIPVTTEPATTVVESTEPATTQPDSTEPVTGTTIPETTPLTTGPATNEHPCGAVRLNDDGSTTAICTAVSTGPAPTPDCAATESCEPPVKLTNAALPATGTPVVPGVVIGFGLVFIGILIVLRIKKTRPV